MQMKCKACGKEKDETVFPLGKYGNRRQPCKMCWSKTMAKCNWKNRGRFAKLTRCPKAPWTVGIYTPDGKWMSEGDYGSKEEATERVHYLNGGNPQIY